MGADTKPMKFTYGQCCDLPKKTMKKEEGLLITFNISKPIN